MYTIYHNPRCKISRQVLADLKNATQNEIQIVDYTKTKFSHQKLADLLNLLNVEPLDIIRKKDPVYISQFKNKNFSREEWIQILVENHKLIERPIVTRGYQGVVCRPPERVFELISKQKNEN